MHQCCESRLAANTTWRVYRITITSVIASPNHTSPLVSLVYAKNLMFFCDTTNSRDVGFLLNGVELDGTLLGGAQSGKKKSEASSLSRKHDPVSSHNADLVRSRFSVSEGNVHYLTNGGCLVSQVTVVNNNGVLLDWTGMLASMA